MEIGEFLSRWCVWLLSVSFPICEKTLTWILMFHLYQRCFSKLAVLVFYSADKKKKSDRQCRMAVLVLMCYLAAVCQVKNRHTQSVCQNSFGTTEKHFKRYRQRFVKGSADTSTNLCPDGTSYTRTRTRRKRTFSCGYLWSSGCLWVWTDSLRQIWFEISGCWRLHLQHLPYKKSHECCLDVSVGRKTLGSENFTGIEKNLRNKTAFLDTFASVETKFLNFETWAKQTNTRTKTLCGQWTTLLTFNTTHMFIFSSLDCNLRLLLTFHSSSANSKLIQNAAAFAPTKTYSCSLIIPVCGSLHFQDSC